MRDRLVTAAGALAALVVVSYLLLQPAAEAPVTRPVSSEPGRNGYLAVTRWLRSRSVEVVSLRERYTALTGAGPAQSGNILVTTLPHLHPVRRAERERLLDWVAAGNTLVMLAALDDTPEWSGAGIDVQGTFFGTLRELAGLDFAVERPADEADEDAEGDGARPFAPSSAPIPADAPVDLVPAGTHPLLDDVETLRGYSDGPSAVWTATPVDPQRLYLRLAVEGSTGKDAMWQTVLGRGQIIVAASGTLLSNHVIADTDARRFVTNLVRNHLGARGAVVFDDMHQGDSVLYDAAAFYGDPRLHRTLAFLLAGWVVYVLGSTNRIAPPPPAPAVPRQGDFVAAVGGLLARRLDRRDAASLLLEEWFTELRRARGLPAGTEPPWDALRATPAFRPQLVNALRAQYERARQRQKVDLVELHNILQQARKASA